MVGSFLEMLESWKDVELTSLIDRILQDTEYEKDLQAEGAIEAESRMENIQELQGKLQSYIEENGDEGSLSAFLEEVSLLSDLDRSDLTEDKITLMTLHGAKGLEFPVVYLVGLNEGLFPSAQSMFTPEEREEERRLFYVGITRAEKELYLTAGRDRVVHGQYQSMLVSSFVDDVPEEHLEKKYLYRKKPSEEDIFMEKTGRSGYSSYLQQANQSIKAYMGQSDSYGSSGSYGSSDSYGSSGSYGSTGAYGSSGRSSSNLYGSAGYSSSKKPLDLQAYQQAGIIQKGISGMSSGSLDYQVGDRVSHMKFGEGEVLAIEEDKKDKLVTVLFDTAGQKKMLAGFAKLKKL
jgi:ATP-dependent DNA helicase pcrA